MVNKLKKILPGIVKNEPMSRHTTFKIGGPAKYFCLAKNSRELLKAAQAAEELNLSYFILGWGSNLLVSDQGYDGLIIKSVSDQYQIKGREIWAESGLNLSRLVGLAAQSGLSGLEKLAGVPGTVGGAARGNAGAYGVSFGDLIKQVELYQAGQIKKISHSEMQYHYRDSLLKHQAGVILAVTLKLSLSEQRNLQPEVIKVIKERNGRLPLEPSAGCIFKNIDLGQVQIDETKVRHELDITQTEWLDATKHGKLSVAYIIERLDLKGKRIGDCQISEKHGAFFVNLGHARAQDVIMLISDIKMRVRNQLGIQLEEEIQYLGF
jgi:UDP-N-acetylmuramate dehydrogenase